MEPPPGVAPPSDRDATSAQSSTIINHPHQQQPLLLGHNVVSSSFAMIPSPSTTAAAHASTSSLSVSPAGPTSIPLAAAASMSSVSGATSTSGSSSGSGQQPPIERLSRPMSFDKMEFLVREMQDAETGVPVRSQKLFLTLIPSAFMGYDLIEWMMERLTIEESEALSIANQLCLHGYFFPVSDTKTLLVKDDSSLYRFQSPYYWPWQHKAPDNVEYAIYLAKRSLRNKQRHGLEEYESEALASLHKNLKGKWEFIQMQAEEQVRLAKDRKKGDKIVCDSQERAYWRVHRPPPGQFTPLEPCPIPSRDRQGKPRRRNVDDWQREVDYLRVSMGRTRMKMSQACECLIQYCDTFSEFDFFIQSVLPSNPWVTEDITYWQLNNQIVDIPTEKRVRRWAISIEELVSDPTGLQEFTAYLKKEYSHENIRFWIAVNDLRRSAASQISAKVKDIYEEFLEPGAPCEINIDGKTMEKVQLGLKTPTRFTFDAAAEHIYALLLKKDCYPRFVRSEHYKLLLATGIQPPHKKRFFGFGVPKKKSTTAAPVAALLSQNASNSGATSAAPAGSLARRRGSDRSLTGSAHELAVSGVRDGSSRVPHSHSQSNLSDIPYSAVVYRGDMPSAGFPLLSATPEDPASIINSACHTTTVTGAAVVVVSASSKISSGATAASFSSAFVSNLPNPSNEAAKLPNTLVDTLVEPTAALEVSHTSSVCPWDDPPDPADPTHNVMHSSVQVSVSAPESASKRSKPRNHSAAGGDSTTGGDISDVSDRMRRSCGLRQSTLDCEMLGPKRLEATSGVGKDQQRRSSMSMTPRLPDPNWSLLQQHQSASIDADATYSPTPSHKRSASSNTAELTLDLANTPESRSCSPNIDHNSLMSTVITEDAELTINTSVTVDDTSDTTTTLAHHTTAVRPDELCVHPVILDDSTSSQATNQISFAITPTITVVCPVGEVTHRDVLDRGGNVITEVTEPVVDSRTTDQIDVPAHDPDTLYGAMDEMSPTTEEYQECCAPDDFQLDGEILAPGCVAPAPTPAPSIAPLAEFEGDPADDDPDPEVNQPSSEETNEGSGVVADVVPIEPIVVIQTVTTVVAPKRLHRKKRSADGAGVTTGGFRDGSVSRQPSEEVAGHNSVCPWEDEDVSAATEAPFVKTYATLGYL